MKEMTVEIGGMHCVMCAAALERSLNRLDGVEQASVSYASETANLDVYKRQPYLEWQTTS